MFEPPFVPDADAALREQGYAVLSPEGVAAWLGQPVAALEALHPHWNALPPDPHLKDGGFATVIGEDVTIGHRAIIHACRIEDACLIGMGAVVMDGAVVKKHGFVGANALVSPGKVVGEGELWLGNPARLVRTLSDKEIESLHYSAAHYVKLKDRYLLPTPPAA